MNRKRLQRISFSLSAVMTLSLTAMPAMASSSVTSVLPTAGISFEVASENVSLASLKSTDTPAPVAAEEEETVTETVEVKKEETPEVLSASVLESLNASASAVGTTEEPEEKAVVEEVTETPAPEPVVSDDGVVIEETRTVDTTVAAEAETEVEETEEAAPEETDTEDAEFRSLVIARVDNFVNVREEPSTEAEVVGKLYDKSAGTFLEEKDGWYKIGSGNVTGYVKAEFVVTGDEAVELAKQVGKRMARVETTTLKVRAEANTDCEVIGLVPMGDELVVKEELDGWVKVEVEEGDGYVSTEFVKLTTEFVKAESKAEEEARLARERAAAEAAAAAAAAAARKNTATAASGKKSSGSSSGKTYTAASGSNGQAVANYACQFVGNPYVYGGTSLTNGADCSGFVMSVYAHFGVGLPHSSAADRSVGRAVEGGLSNAQPGDIVCYSGHVGIYIGGGQIVHASSAKTGIKISNAGYRTPLSVRRIF